MEACLKRGRLQEIVRGFESRSVLVIGDLMVDEYLRGSVRRISPESPVMVVEIESDDFKPGGAANVANSLRALDARVAVAGIVGDDEMGRLLRAELSVGSHGVDGILTDSSRPTTRKTRIVAQHQQVLRVDREQTHPLDPEVADRLLCFALESLRTVDAILVSDYRKGVVTPEIAGTLVEAARAAGKPLVTNPKPSSAAWLRGATVLSLNQLEAEEFGHTRLPENEPALMSHGEALRAELDVDTLVITQGSRGLVYWTRAGEARRAPAHPVEVFDVAGAGDTTISAMTLALLSGATTFEAATIANRAGACVVRKSGVASVSIRELLAEE